MVALDGRQYHPRGNKKGHRVDEPRRNRGIPLLRGCIGHRTDCARKSGLYVAAVERLFPICHAPGRFARHGNGHRQLPGMEQHGRSMGEARECHEEADVAHPIKFDAGIFNNNTISDYEPTYTNKKRHPALTIVCWILAAFFLYYAIKLSIQGNRNVQFQDSNTPKYSYTIEKMGKNEEGFYCLTGTVTSNTNKTADGLKIEFKCYDSSGNYIVSLYDYIENLDSGETWSYDIKDIFNSDKISSCNYYQIVPYTKIVEFH